MDESHFDDLARSLALPSRRGIVTAVGTAALAALVSRAAPDLARAKRKKKKKTICHNGQTIKVAKSKVKGHLAHGDTLGPCAPVSTRPPPTGCPSGTRECAARGFCIPLTHCCTDSDCAPGGGGACQTDGTCSCTAPWRACGEAASVCALCCADQDCCNNDLQDCTDHAVCRDRACRCPNDDCTCPEAGDTIITLACRPGLNCFCYVDLAASTSRCGVASATCGVDCLSQNPCAPGEFCGLCHLQGRLGTCTTTCGA
jgi:hypothetical protein